ncbi:MAG: hypothetical protein IPH54_11660 [Rhodoferax sp.]|jgi:hypothetical protein|nr:hypothetical protein [Rhodoferax sp.]
MQDLNFEKIVGRIMPLDGNPLEYRSCSDQYLGTLSEIIGRTSFPLRVAASERSAQPCIVMVLESPHVDEFIGTPGPAKGFTGDMIRNHLPDALRGLNHDGFGLILINAIQHQCSLGADTSLHRDVIFRAVWAAGGRENFCTRLLSVVRTDDILINCCTKGNDFETNDPLRSLVEASIRDTLPSTASVRRMHPASWRNASFRGVEWRYQPLDGKNMSDIAQTIDQTPSNIPTNEGNVYWLKDKVVEAKFLDESARAEAEQSSAFLSAPDTLVMVKEKQMVRGSSCTILVMGDGSQRHMKTLTFDPDGAITQKAKTLVGTRVRTSCWDPKGNPGRWSSQGYFRNIYTSE